MFLRYDLQTLVAVSKAGDDGIQKYLPGVRHLLDTSVVTIRYYRPFMEHLNGISATSTTF